MDVGKPQRRIKIPVRRPVREKPKEPAKTK